MSCSERPPEPEYRNDMALDPEEVRRMTERLLSDADDAHVPMKVMTPDEYLRHLLVDNPSVTFDPVSGKITERKGAFEAPCDWCSGGDMKLNHDGTCPICGYDW